MRAPRPARPLCRAPGHGNRALRSPVLARWLAGQLQEDIVERRSAQAHLADADLRATQFGGGFLDQDEALPRRRQRQAVRSPVLLRLAAADAEQCGPGLLPLALIRQLDLEDVTRSEERRV